MTGRYIGLDRPPPSPPIGAIGATLFAARMNRLHNAAVPADEQSDTCACPTCRGGSSPLAAAQPGPAADLAPLPSAAAGPGVHLIDAIERDMAERLAEADAWEDWPASRVPAADIAVRAPAMLCGPVQDESQSCDPLDRAAMRAVEGEGA